MVDWAYALWQLRNTNKRLRNHYRQEEQWWVSKITSKYFMCDKSNRCAKRLSPKDATWRTIAGYIVSKRRASGAFQGLIHGRRVQISTWFGGSDHSDEYAPTPTRAASVKVSLAIMVIKHMEWHRNEFWFAFIYAKRSRRHLYRSVKYLRQFYMGDRQVNKLFYKVVWASQTMTI